MLIQHVAPGDAVFAAIYKCTTFCGEDPRRGDFAGQSQRPLNSYGSTATSDGYSVEEQLAARMRFLAQRPMVRYTIRRSLGGLKSG